MSSTLPGPTTGPCRAPCCARPRATSSGSGSRTPDRTPTRSTSTASIRRRWTASSRSSTPARSFVYEFEARPAGFHPYHCHSTPLKKHIHKGLYGALIIDPEQPRPDGAGARDGDERLRHRRRRREQLLHRQRPQLLLRPLSDHGQPLEARPHLPGEPDRVRPAQLLPPPRRLLPLPAERDRRRTGSTPTS